MKNIKGVSRWMVGFLIVIAVSILPTFENEESMFVEEEEEKIESKNEDSLDSEEKKDEDSLDLEEKDDDVRCFGDAIVKNGKVCWIPLVCAEDNGIIYSTEIFEGYCRQNKETPMDEEVFFDYVRCEGRVGIPMYANYLAWIGFKDNGCRDRLYEEMDMSEMRKETSRISELVLNNDQFLYLYDMVGSVPEAYRKDGDFHFGYGRTVFRLNENKNCVKSGYRPENNTYSYRELSEFEPTEIMYE